MNRISCSDPFDFTFDQIEMKKEVLRKAIYEESEAFQMKKVPLRTSPAEDE